MKAGITFLGVLCLACVGIGLWEILNGYIPHAIFTFAVAAYLIAVGICVFIFRKKKQEQKTTNDEGGAKRKTPIGAMAGIAALLLCFVGIVLLSASDSYQDDMRTIWLLEQKIDRIEEVELNDLDNIKTADEEYENLPGNLKKRVSNADLLFKAKEEFDVLLEDLADQCDAAIIALKKKGVSFTESFSDEIENVYDDIEKYPIKEKLENYHDFQEMYSKYDGLKASHKVSCRTTIACEYCGGSGKSTVTFYEYGDWGEKSYSSYTCTYCDGTGDRTCSLCHGKGYYYQYDSE